LNFVCKLSRNGSAEVAEYLLSHCGAPIEQKGLFEVCLEIQTIFSFDIGSFIKGNAKSMGVFCN
jgi:hypothetical protein